jgi:peptidoglycan-N-acetylglucosamine deacetylase
VLGHALPSVTAIAAVRNRLTPRLSGATPGRRVALTFDDGPDPISTPAFLEVLAQAGVHATFFVLGEMLARAPGLGREVRDGGHELAVHGWDHRAALLAGPRRTDRELARTVELIVDTTGVTPRHYRPAYGILSGAGLFSARRLGLTPVLWTCAGREWTRGATAAEVHSRLVRDLTPGGTVLLHDSDVTSPPGSARAALGALPGLIAECVRRGLPLGSLAEREALAGI